MMSMFNVTLLLLCCTATIYSSSSCSSLIFISLLSEASALLPKDCFRQFCRASITHFFFFFLAFMRCASWFLLFVHGTTERGFATSRERRNMPKSKRNKVVHLTRTKSKGRAGKESLVDQVQGAIDEHKTLYVFQVSNMRTVHMKEVRAELGKGTRLFFGKNRWYASLLEEHVKKRTWKISKRCQMCSAEMLVYSSPTSRLQR